MGLALQNTDGQIYLFDMQGPSVVGGDNIGNYGSDWHVAATGDFFGDGHPDLVLQDTATGDIYLLDIKDSVVGGGNVGNFGSDWHVVGTGNFTSDGNTDIVLQDTTGQIGLLDMSGDSVVGFRQHRQFRGELAG